MTLLSITAYRLIKNELVSLMGRTPTKEEIREFMKNIYENTSDDIRLSDVFSCMYDYLHNNFVECQHCGTWYKKEDMHTVDSNFDDGVYYCEHCVDAALEEAAFDPHEEWGTDGRHTC